MPKQVRCKFLCNEVTKSTSGDGFVWSYKFNAVYNNSPENAEYWKWTPSGSLTLTSINQDLFEPGEEYYLDIKPAEGRGG